MELWELQARELVRQAYTRYSTAGDGGRLEELANVFAEDGVMEVPPRPPATGRAAILDSLSSALDLRPPVSFAGQKPILRHFTTNIHFRSISPERIETTAYFCAMTAVGPDHWGRYFDELVPVGEDWLFHHRVAKTEGYAKNGWYHQRQ